MPPIVPSIRWLSAWVLLTVLACIAIAGWRHHALRTEFDSQARALSRAVAQRVDQHDAHLTNLAAVAQLDDPGQAGFLAVASAVRKYYPRITAIHLVGLSPVPRVIAASAESSASPGWLATLGGPVATLAPGRASIFSGAPQGAYLLVKRVGSEPLSALVLTIDAARLVAADSPIGMSDWALISPGAATLGDASVASGSPALTTLQSRTELESASQPLQLVQRRILHRADLLPTGLAVLAAIVAAGLLAATVAMLRLRLARRQSRLQAQELRLAHAMRVNGLGELASGIAHELTQPMTALLSQNQAALRLLQSGAPAHELEGVIHTNIRLVRRSSAILDRMRSYVSQRALRLESTDLAAVAQGVADLTRADLHQRGIDLQVQLSEPVHAMVDPVSLEQVLHNLVRNAAEAFGPGSHHAAGGSQRRITLSTRPGAESPQVCVEDTGPGIAAQDMAKVFTPFFTTKPGGMGLGLPLCERLVEAMGGRIEWHSEAARGTRFTVHLRPAGPEAA